MLNESRHDKGSLKFVFLAGSIGSGKTYVASQLFGIGKNNTFGNSGMKLISFDHIFELALKKMGVSVDVLDSPYKEDFDKYVNEHNPQSLYSQCRRLVKNQMKQCIKEGTGIIFDATGRMLYSYEDKKKLAEEMGYDTFMVYVDTSLPTALDRNQKRARSLPEDIIAKTYRDVKRNKPLYEKLFGPENFLAIDNEEGSTIPPEAFRKVNEIMNAPVKNPIGQEFQKTGKRPKPKPPVYDFDPNMFKSWQGGFSTQTSYPPKTDKPKSSSYNPGQFDWVGRVNAKNNTASQQDDDLMHQRIHNPETGNDIFIKTALHYPPDHPMHQKAQAFLQANKKPQP